ncbi:hypothetical protein [Streptomyces avermitilis]|uniref:hypothetical protein n=1 Tax=Streptomyces avermitilis TaxID=33903 RepID=UPI000A9C98E2|nr:hypothetical protein [Streptomyces avermitilis]
MPESALAETVDRLVLGALRRGPSAWSTWRPAAPVRRAPRAALDGLAGIGPSVEPDWCSGRRAAAA